MRRVLSVCAFAACLAWLSPVNAQFGDDYDDSLAENLCTDPVEPDGKCSLDDLAISLTGAAAGSLNFLEYAEFTAGMTVTATVMVNSASPDIQGWSYGVASDEAVVSITDEALTMDGTDAGANVGDNPFTQNVAVEGGFISAVVLDLFGNGLLPAGGGQSLLIATYTLDVDAGTGGTLIRFVDQEIGVAGSPPVEILITAQGGKSKQGQKLYQGKIAKEGIVGEDCPIPDPWLLSFGPAASDAEDSVPAGGATVISSRNTAAILGFQVGVSVSATKQWSFSDAMGNNEILETIFTDVTGVSVIPTKFNTAQAVDDVTAVTKGSATEGFANDFFQVDLSPEQGGDGFIVGFVADVVNGTDQIPATATDDVTCPTNEILVIQTGEAVEGAPFNRGDANGDGKFNVTDGILIVQAQVGNIASSYPDCPAINDANGDGANDLSDAIYLLNYVFVTTAPAPPAPFRACASAVGAVCAVDSGNCTP